MNDATLKIGKHLLETHHNYVVIDIETTGLSAQNNEVIEIAAVKVRSNYVVDTLQLLSKPSSPVSSRITELTGITNEMLSGCEPEIMSLLKLKEFIGDDVLVFHNASFDFNFLNKRLVNNELQPLHNNYICTLRHAKKCFTNLSSYKLGALANEFELAGSNTHRALDDALLTHELLIHIYLYNNRPIFSGGKNDN